MSTSPKLPAKLPAEACPQPVDADIMKAYWTRVFQPNLPPAPSEGGGEKETTALAVRSQGLAIAPTANEALAAYMPDKLSKTLARVTTVEQGLALAAEGKIDSIGALIRAGGAERVDGLIKVHLVRLNMLTGVKTPLNEAQIEFIAAELCTNYRTLTMADVHIILHRAVTGVYGQLYESITPPKVLGWFAEYFEEKCEAAANLSERNTSDKRNMGSDDRRYVPQAPFAPDPIELFIKGKMK